MGALRGIIVWSALALAVAVPLTVAAASPLLAWRDPVYIVAGFAGILALAGMLLQPLLASGRLPGLPMQKSRPLHRFLGLVLLVLVLAHVGGLWLTSPPDVVDALLYASPTPFSAWGVTAMWALFAAAGLAFARARVRPMVWRFVHTALALLVVICTVVHAVMIEGAMGTVSKWALCLMSLGGLVWALVRLGSWRVLWRRS